MKTVDAGQALKAATQKRCSSTRLLHFDAAPSQSLALTLDHRTTAYAASAAAISYLSGKRGGCPALDPVLPTENMNRSRRFRSGTATPPSTSELTNHRTSVRSRHGPETRNLTIVI
jgi:hypothetical protein